MGLRNKLASTFVILLTAAVIAASVLDISRSLRVMANDVIDSGNMVTAEIFEQMRTVLAHAQDDQVAALRSDPSLNALIDSVRAFAKGIVFIGIETPDGKRLMGENAEKPSAAAPAKIPPVESLRATAMSGWPLALLPTLWSEHNFEIQRPVLINNQPFAVIRVGVSTALIADDVHHLVWVMLTICMAIIALAAVAGAAMGELLSRSVLAITTGVEQLALGAEDVKLKVAGHDELGNLAEKFNRLSRQVLTERNRWENERGGLFKALRSMTDAIILLDAEGTILFANAEAHARLRFGAAGNGDGKRLATALGGGHPLVRMVEAAFSTGAEAHDVAVELRDSTHKQVHYLVSIFPLSQGREAAGLLVTLRDLKPMTELETVVEYSSHLARLGGLISGVAHQIRKPLNLVAIRLEWLRQDAEQGRPVAPHVENIHYEIHRLDRVVDGLLRFMRPEQLEYKEVSVPDLLAEAGGQVSSSSIQVEYHIAEDLAVLKADQSLLGEALKNIFQNAAEAMPAGGTITARASSSRDGFIEILIIDQGNGIARENIDRIFDLYFTTKPTGTGLGLSLASRAVDLHHGTIDIASEVGLGTTVRVRLPADRQAGIGLMSTA